VKRQATHWEKIFVIIRVSDKGLLYRIEKNSNRKKKSQLKIGQNILTKISQKDIKMPVGI